MKTKDVDKLPVLKFIKELNGEWATIHPGFKNSVCNSMPEEIPPKLALSVMKSLVKRGLVDGCTCGCRGDFVLTKKGKEFIND